MVYSGHVKNGQIAVDVPVTLPEGSAVKIEVIDTSQPSSPRAPREPRQFKPIELPGGPLADDIVRERR
jgi:hypothetical protein